jgi:GT2 family glycosyltransferase
MQPLISLIIPNRNAGATIKKCLEAASALSDKNYEVIVVDDSSEDHSVEIIQQFRCKLIRLKDRSGASKARNVGAGHCSGDIVLFTDADCVLPKDFLARVRKALSEHGRDVVIGGTYTQKPYDNGFFSTFQSIFINYSETKKFSNPDYVASHAMVLRTATFDAIGGFSENFLPILEDVELSHRLRRAGYRLLMDPSMQVQHIFNYTLKKSLKNAVRKTHYWTLYSMRNHDLSADSGTASIELKLNGMSWFLTLILTILCLVFKQKNYLVLVPVLWIVSAYANKNIYLAFYRAKGAFFSLAAVIYYTAVYPAAILLGACKGLTQYYVEKISGYTKGIQKAFFKHT